MNLRSRWSTRGRAPRAGGLEQGFQADVCDLWTCKLLNVRSLQALCEHQRIGITEGEAPQGGGRGERHGQAGCLKTDSTSSGVELLTGEAFEQEPELSIGKV